MMDNIERANKKTIPIMMIKETFYATLHFFLKYKFLSMITPIAKIPTEKLIFQRSFDFRRCMCLIDTSLHTRPKRIYLTKVYIC
jgi:hypothetical protein